MTGRFRFTPACCCSDSTPPEPTLCVQPCVPECAEIFSGSFVNNTEDYVLINRTNPVSPDYFLPDCGSKVPFSIREFPQPNEGDRFLAEIVSQSAPDHNYITVNVVYTLHYQTGIRAFAAPAAYCEPPVSFPIDENYNYVEVNVTNSHGVIGASNTLNTCSYDTPIWHTSDPVESARTFCLPFDLTSQPFQFCDGATAISLESAPYLSLSDCGFTFDTYCGQGFDIQKNYRILHNANTFKSAWNDLSFTHNVLDFYIVRLFGFGSPVCVPGVGTADSVKDFLLTDVAGISVQFAITSLERLNNHDKIVCGQICVEDFPKENQIVDWSNVELPPGLSRYHEWTTWDQPADYTHEYYSFVSKQTSNSYSHSEFHTYPVIPSYADFETQYTNIPCSYKFGRIEDMPTVWRSPLKAVTKEQDTNDKRFHGIYWIKCAITPCAKAYPPASKPFPQDVTHGILWSVPVGRITISGHPTISPGDSIGGVGIAYFNATYNRLNSADRNVTWGTGTGKQSLKFAQVKNYPADRYVPVDPDVGESFYEAEWKGPYLVDCFIPKPSGKRLTQLHWRVLKKYNYYPVSNPHPGYAVALPCSITTDNDSVSGTGTPYFGNYDVTNLDLYEVSVNSGLSSGTFETFTDSETGETCYVPYFGANHFRQYLGTTEFKLYTILGHASILDAMNDVKIYPRLDFGYIAVWEDE